MHQTLEEWIDAMPGHVKFDLALLLCFSIYSPKRKENNLHVVCDQDRTSTPSNMALIAPSFLSWYPPIAADV